MLNPMQCAGNSICVPKCQRKTKTKSWNHIITKWTCTVCIQDKVILTFPRPNQMFYLSPHALSFVSTHSSMLGQSSQAVSKKFPRMIRDSDKSGLLKLQTPNKKSKRMCQEMHQLEVYQIHDTCRYNVISATRNYLLNDYRRIPNRIDICDRTSFFRLVFPDNFFMFWWCNVKEGECSWLVIIGQIW